MSTKRDIENPARRKFFKTAAAGAVAVGLGAGAPAKAEVESDHRSSRYRLTEHVKQAYTTARF